MSSYFDAIGQRIAATSEDNAWEELGKIEEELVRDVTVCAMFPDFPDDLRLAIHKTVLRYGVTCLPTIAYPRDFETVEQHKTLLYELNGDLHSIFHEAAHRGLGDHPLNPLRRLYALGDAEREQLVLALPAWICSDSTCGKVWGHALNGVCLCPRCNKPGVYLAGKTLAKYREESGYNVPSWECPEGHPGWSSKDELPCATCGAKGLRAGFSYGQAKDAGMDYPVRPT